MYASNALEMKMAPMARRPRNKTRKATDADPRPASEARTTLPEPRSLWWAPPILVVAAVIAYWNSFAGVFLFDDIQNIVNNTDIRSLTPLSDLLKSSRRPLVTLTFALNYAWTGPEPWSYHLVNLAIHILAGLTLFGLVRRTIELPRFRHRFADSAPYIALTVALLWLVHPLQTQSVTYIVQRGEALMGLCYLLTLYCVLRGSTAHRLATLWYAAAIIACAAGMFSKAVMITAPVATLLFDRLVIAPDSRPPLRKRWPLYAGLAATWLLLLTLKIPQGVLNPAHRGPATVGFAFKGVSPIEYALSQPAVILHYLGITLWPANLCLDYRWDVADSLPTILGPSVLLLTLLAATIYALWKYPPIGFIAAFFFIVLAPTSSFIPIRDLAFEHRMYLPLASVILLLTLAGWRFLQACQSQAQVAPTLPRTGAAIAVAAIAIGATVRTLDRNRDYHDEIRMWLDVAKQSPQNYRAHQVLGAAFGERREYDKSIRHSLESLRLNPNQARAHDALGVAYKNLGRFDEALQHLHEALRIDPKYYQTHFNLANLYAQLDRMSKARQYFESGFALKPKYALGHNNYGMALAREGRLEEAREHFETALRIDPYFAAAHSNLGNALASQGHRDQAAAAYRRALQLDPTFCDAHNNLGCLLLEDGDYSAAQNCFREAIRLRPDKYDAYRNLGITYLRSGKPRDAISYFEAALERAPDDPVARQGLERAKRQLPEDASP